MKSLLTNSGTVPLELSELPCDHDLPGLASLLHEERLTTTLSCVLAGWLEPNAQLLQTRVFLRRLFPGKRCSVELELVVDKDVETAIATFFSKHHLDFIFGSNLQAFEC